MRDRALDDEIGRLAALERIGPDREGGRYARFARMAQEVLGVPLVAVTLIDAGRQRVCTTAGLPLPEGPRSAAFCDRTIRGREVLVVPDATADPRFAGNPYVVGPPGLRAYMGAPLSTPDGYNLGALCAIDLVPRSFRATEAALLASLARLISDEMLRAAPERDPLTGALSRAAWAAAAEREIARARAGPAGGASTLLLCEAEGVGAANARYGRAAGDEALRATAEALRVAVGPAAAVGRVAGDQFVALLPGFDGPSALALADAVRGAMAGAETTLLPPGAAGASLGAAMLAPAVEDADLWLAAAEVSLAFHRDRGRRGASAVG